MIQPSSQIIIQIDNLHSEGSQSLSLPAYYYSPITTQKYSNNLGGYVNETISQKNETLKDFHLIESKYIFNKYVNQSIYSPKFSKADINV